MPLQDHFHSPLNEQRHWHAFHNAWATYLSSALNRCLPPGYFAEANVQFGIEIDVASFQEHNPVAGGSSNGAPEWSPPAPALTLPMALISDIVEIAVYRSEEGPVLAGAMELVSPANKDREVHRSAFVSKCASCLQQGVGLVIVDIVTSRRANLHQELLLRLGNAASNAVDAELYAASYRPLQLEGQTKLEIWPETLAVGRRLPTLPLWLRGGLCLPVDLEATYQRTCQEQRIGNPEGNGTNPG
jgi:hypothetical protein